MSELLFRAKLQAASTSVSPQAFDVSGEGRTPLAATYELTPCFTAGTITAGYRYGCGATDGTTHRAHSVFFETAVNANLADSGGRHDTASVVHFTNAANTSLNGEAIWDSWNAGGSDVLWPDFLGAPNQVKVVYAMEGDWALVEFTHGGAQDAALSISGLAFAPDFVQAFGNFEPFGSVDPNRAYNALSRMGMGYAVKTPAGGVQQVSLTDTIIDNATPTEGATDLRDDCVTSQHSPSADGPRLEVTAWTADGLTFTKRNAATSITMQFLVGRTGRRLYAGVITLDTDATGNKTISDVGFLPEGYRIIATDLAAKNSKATDASTSKWSHGIYTGAESACVSVQAEDAASVSDNRSIAEAVIAHVIDDAGGTSWKASHVSMGSTGPVISIDDASAADRVVAIVAWGPAAVSYGETVEIADAARLVHSSLQAAETVELSDAHVFDVTGGDVSLEAGETVAIADAALLVPVHILTVGETVEIEEAAAFHVEHILQVDETEEILDDARFSGTGVLFEANETISISDGAILVLGDVLVAGETVSILDSHTFGDGLVPSKASPGRGRTVEGGAEMGRTVDGGNVKGGTV